MSKGAWILLLILVTGVLGGLAGYKSAQRERISDEAREAALSLLSRPALADEGDYMRSLVDRHHDEAFGLSYHRGGLTISSYFDEELYFHELWTRVEAQLTKEGKSELSKYLPHFEHHLEADRLPTGAEAL